MLISFFALTIIINVSGKGNLLPSSASDQVQNYVLGGIIGGVIYSSSIQILDYIGILCTIITHEGEENPKLPLITDGQLQTDILQVIGKDEKWLLKEMNKQGLKAYGDVFLGEYVDGKLNLTAYW